ncbi:hypothetical protein Fmac_008153 [Flemingia macrophylla]|uniref:WPP domain-containing protein n=1 Tax=Flemingia macrophylla TaxID=520843 RepID=A0ABD1MWM9_9FABA
MEIGKGTPDDDVRSLRNATFIRLKGEGETMVDYDARLTERNCYIRDNWTNWEEDRTMEIGKGTPDVVAYSIVLCKTSLKELPLDFHRTWTLLPPSHPDFAASAATTFSSWPSSQRTRDIVINRLVGTLSATSVLSNCYNTLSSDESSIVAC